MNKIKVYQALEKERNQRDKKDKFEITYCQHLQGDLHTQEIARGDLHSI